tara:strand:+ start:653 stop:901 length:249 start_codon:yes stop_codon:yes gene_type:complete
MFGGRMMVHMKPGDYVVVVNNVHDEQMPKDRRDGIVLELMSGSRSYGLKHPDQAMVLFSNGAMLKFHVSQLSVLKSKDDFYL